MNTEEFLNGHGNSKTYQPGYDFSSEDGNNRKNLKKFEFVTVGSVILNLRPPRWLIDGFIEQHTMGSIFGDPGSGKSFVAIDIACCIATGMAWHGYEVMQGTVFYIAGEGHNGLARRFGAWQQHYGVSLEHAPLYIAKRPAQLCDLANAEAVADAVQELADATGQKPSIIFIDTLARNFGDGDENSTQDMSKFVRHVDDLKDRWECAAFTVHHTGHADKSRGRGAMALKGALDHEFRIQKNDGGMVAMECTKNKDGPDLAPLHFQFETVMVPYSGGNIPIESAILAKIEQQPKQTGKKLTGQKKRAVEILRNCLIDKGAQRNVRQNMPSVMCVKLDEFRQALKDGNLTSSDKPDSVAKAIVRAIDDLNNTKITVTYGEYIWLPDKPDKAGQTRN